jgi:maleylacetate reductase
VGHDAVIEPFSVDLLFRRVVFGRGSLEGIREAVSELGVARVHVIAGGAAVNAGDRASALLRDLVVGIFGTVRQHVPEELAVEATSTVRGSGADGVVALGGGSAIGLGKVVAVELEIPLIAIPTTYSGSEMTAVYGITAERKVTRRDIRALPKLVIYDPTLTVALPSRVTASSGFNALAHCMEAVVGPVANPPAALLAEEAMRILPDALRACVEDPANLDARAMSSYGAFLAGLSLGYSGTGLQHRLAHILGGRFGLVHADAHAALLPHVAAFHERETPAAMTGVAEAIGTEGSAAAALHRLAVEIGAPLALADLGMTRDGIQEVVTEAESDAIGALLEDAFEGRPPRASHRSAADL